MAEKTVQQNTKQLVRAHARNLRISPRKMRLVTNLVKNMSVNDALVQLQFTNKKAAIMVSKLLQSAAANAEHNFSMNREGLFVKTITCDMGPVLQRAFPRARGSAFVIRRKMSHVNVILEEREVKVKKTAPKLPKTKKAEKPVKTQEGQLGLPVEEIETPKVVEVDAKEVKHGNESEVVEQKTSPQNLQK